MDTKANDPNEWGKEWTDTSKKVHTGHINPWYPTDDRDTIYPPYERIAPTGTVGELFAARERIGARERREAEDPNLPSLPVDYNNYLAQRTAWPTDKLQSMFSDDTPLDAKGNPTG